MSVTKLKASNSQTAKSDEGNESLDTIIRHAIGKEPFLSFSRAGDSPVQWIQLLHALDQPDLPGWPLLSPLKVQMQKCDKCSREFCSPINHRRHVRVDHRPRKLDSSVDRDKLRTFWDELSLDKAKETVSFENATLEEVAGSSIIASLTSLVKKQGLSSLPQACVKAGSALLGLVHGEFHERISSEKLFNILDDASEKTFLCGKAEAVQKYVFDGEAGKIDLEKNIVACTSFLVEQKMVKAWHDHKDLEAMEAQESLLLEEDAAKESGKGLNSLGQTRKQKPQRKLKKKERKAKAEVKESTIDMRKTLPPAETTTILDITGSDLQLPQTQPDTVPASVNPFHLSNMDEDVSAEAPSGSDCGHAEPEITQYVKRATLKEQKLLKQQEDTPKVITHAETPSPVNVSGSNSHSPLEPIQHSNTDENVVSEAPSGSGCRLADPGIAQTVERVTGRRDIAPRRQAPSKSRAMANVGFHGTHNDSRAAPIVNVNKVWSPKPKLDFDGESSKIRVQKEAANQSEQNKKCEVFIVGSIPVTLGRSGIQQENNLPGAQDDYLAEHLMPKKNSTLEKPVKQNSVWNGTYRPSGKHWRPVSRHETGVPLSVQNGYRESDASAADVIVRKCGDRECNTPNNLPEGSSKDLSSVEVKAFLAQRWKEAIAADHLKLFLSPDLEPPRCSGPEAQIDSQIATAIPSKLPRVAGSLKSSSSAGGARSKSGKPEKGVTTRYIRKDKTTIVP